MTDSNSPQARKLGDLTSDMGVGSAPQPMQAGHEALLEDIFGLNIRSLRTLKTLFRTPSDYFEAAKSSDWGFFRFTPSPRLWLGLIALTVATRFIWGSDDGDFMEVVTQQAEAGFMAGVGENADKLPPIDWTEAVTRSFDIALLVQPFIMLAMMLFLATFIRFWGEKLPYVVRVRYLFAVIIPATVINLLLTFVIVFIPASAIGIISIAQIFLVLVLYAWTAARGPFINHPRDSGVPKAIMLAIILFVAVMFTNFIAQAIGLFAELLPTVREAIEAAQAAA